LFAQFTVRQFEATSQLEEFSDWMAIDAIVPEGRWFKRFGGFTICGEGELVKTFLISGQLPEGEEVF
jgi:hypothetical protein